jgi:hypothetical protein
LEDCFCFFALIFYLVLMSDGLLRERRLMPFLLQSLASSFLSPLTRITHARACGLHYFFPLGNLLEWICFCDGLGEGKEKQSAPLAPGGHQRSDTIDQKRVSSRRMASRPSLSIHRSPLFHPPHPFDGKTK